MAGIMIYSHSRLTTYEACPWMWYNHYLLGREEDSSELLQTGKVVHRTVELYYKGGKSNLEVSLLQAFTEEATKGLDWKGIRRMTEIAIQYIEDQRVVSDPSQWKIETHFQLPLDPDDPFSPEIQGYIDFLDMGTASLIDWKTGFKVYDAKQSHQLGLYAWVVSQLYGYGQVSGNLYFLRKKQIKPSIYIHDDMEKARLWAYNLATEIEQKLWHLETGIPARELFPSTPGNSCQYCPVARECGQEQKAPEGTEKEVEPPKTAEDAIALAKEIQRQDAFLGAMKEVLKAFVKEYGPVTADGNQWDNWPSEGWSLPAEGKKYLAKILTEKGVNPWTVFSLGASEMKTLKIVMNWSDAQYEEYVRKAGGKIKITKSFRSKKVAAPQELEENKMSEAV